MTANPIPTLSSWAGGLAAFENLFDVFYSRIPNDPVLAPVFKFMSPDHSKHVAAFVDEVFGGGKTYSNLGGSHAAMIGKHLNKHLTEIQRKRWITMLQECADDVGMPDDPEFRAALVSYLEWGTRLAMINSQSGVEAPDAGLAMPTWGWGPPGGPYIID